MGTAHISRFFPAQDIASLKKAIESYTYEAERENGTMYSGDMTRDVQVRYCEHLVYLDCYAASCAYMNLEKRTAIVVHVQHREAPLHNSASDQIQKLKQQRTDIVNAAISKLSTQDGYTTCGKCKSKIANQFIKPAPPCSTQSFGLSCPVCSSSYSLATKILTARIDKIAEAIKTLTQEEDQIAKQREQPISLPAADRAKLPWVLVAACSC
jgi:hypothetical protein